MEQIPITVVVERSAVLVNSSIVTLAFLNPGIELRNKGVVLKSPTTSAQSCEDKSKIEYSMGDNIGMIVGEGIKNLENLDAWSSSLISKKFKCGRV